LEGNYYFYRKIKPLEDKRYAVIGAGLVGSLLSVMLAKKGYHTEVWERRGDIRKGGLLGGRSINLALSHRGLRALELIGLTDEVKKLCIPMFGREVHDENGQGRFMQYGKDGEAINSISRSGLNEMLLAKASEYPNIKFNFDSRCEDINFEKNEISFKNKDNLTSKHTYDVIFGTDGAFSSVRQAMMKSDRFDFEYKQEYLAHSYKELSIPAALNGEWQLKKDALHIWPRKSFMMIALPNLDGSFTCTLFLALKGEISFDKLRSKEEVNHFFRKYFPDAYAMMPSLEDDFFENPTPSLATIKCGPWFIDGKCTLLGDAAHPIVPFYGQGMNAGFEDCTIMNQLMDRHPQDWNTILREFYMLRKPNGDAVADLALMNFIEMRDLVADPAFIVKNKIDRKIAALFPDKWDTLYSMVTFGDTPYANAMKIGKEHQQILDKIISDLPAIESILEEDSTKELLGRYLS
jgi:kynurenine 3-monooxygenase